MTLKDALRDKARKLEALAALLDDADIRKEVEAWQVQADSPKAQLEPPPQVVEQPDEAKPMVRFVNPHNPVVRHEKKRGLQAQVLRALYTGPATVDELSKCCGFDRRVVLDIVGGMRSNGYATYGGNGMVKLTALGQRVSEHMAQNPRARALPPGGVAQMQQRVNGEARA